MAGLDPRWKRPPLCLPASRLSPYSSFKMLHSSQNILITVSARLLEITAKKCKCTNPPCSFLLFSKGTDRNPIRQTSEMLHQATAQRPARNRGAGCRPWPQLGMNPPRPDVSPPASLWDEYRRSDCAPPRNLPRVVYTHPPIVSFSTAVWSWVSGVQHEKKAGKDTPKAHKVYI